MISLRHVEKWFGKRHVQNDVSLEQARLAVQHRTTGDQRVTYPPLGQLPQ